jgi:hypothetical protein
MSAGGTEMSDDDVHEARDGLEAPDARATRDTARTIVQRGRAKAYRPLPVAARRKALRTALDAYRRGDYFLAHELLEPAWMGTDDPVERDLHQGLIKLAAGFVHAVRVNPVGERKNLEGARERLDDPRVAALALEQALPFRLDVPSIVAAIDDRLARLAADPARPILDPVPLARSEIRS